MRILSGYMDWLLDFVIDHDIDYLMLGHHYYQTDENRDAGTRIYFGGIRTLQELRLYVEDAVAAMETGMYSCFCHPELFMRGIHEVNAEVKEAFRTLCACALDNGIPLEYNLAGAAITGPCMWKPIRITHLGDRRTDGEYGHHRHRCA